MSKERQTAFPYPELRYAQVQFRADEARDLVVSGVPIVYNRETVLWESGNMRELETIAPGSYSTTHDVAAVWNHNTDIVLGRISAGTLSLVETESGVEMELTLPDTPEGRSKYESIKRGDVNKMSFGFNIVDAEESNEVIDGKRVYRTLITQYDLWEVSPVTFPAYEQTSVAARGKQRLEEHSKRSADRAAAAALRRSEIRKTTIMEA